MPLAIPRAVWYSTRVMPLIGDLFLVGPFIIGTLASGFTRSVGNMIIWGIFALLPLTLAFLFLNILLSSEPIVLLWLHVMWGGALAIHLAVSAFIRYARRSFELTREKSES